MTHITTEVDTEPLIRLAFNVGVLDINLLGGEIIFGATVYMVFLNGNYHIDYFYEFIFLLVIL